MKFAIVQGHRQEAQPRLSGRCPVCGSAMIAKCGQHRVWHWAHHSIRPCDSWWEPETAWHRFLKNKFPVDWQEILHWSDIGEKHVADVKTGSGVVLEFQHSPLSQHERVSREAFYGKMVWVVHASARGRANFLKVIVKRIGRPPIYAVRSDAWALLRTWGDSRVPVYFDFGDGDLNLWRRIVAVGNTVYTSKRWKTFHDFLRQYLISKLGADWFKAEQAKPFEQRHPIVRWFDQAIADVRRNSTKVGEVYSGPMTGAQRAFLNLAYNIYLIAHHADPKQVKVLLPTSIDTLKSERADDFVGKLFETYAAAAFLKAGFQLSYEDESDRRSSHVEFVATYTKTGKKFSVEVKSRNRAAVEDGPVDDIRRLRVASKLNRALTKKADHTRIVMIEVNVPDVFKTEEEAFNGWPKAALAQIRQAEAMPTPDGSEKPSAYVVVTNHAFHNNLEAVDAGSQVIAAGCKIGDFGPDVRFNRLKAVLESEQRHREMFALIDSIRNHYEIPSTFNGENPALAFRDKSDVPPLRIGEWYAISGPDGVEVPGRLMDAVVDEDKKTIMGIYQTETDNFMVTDSLTDAELAAWKLHPETYFGEVRLGTHNENWLDMAKFMYESYRHTPRERLLQWMKGAPNYEVLAKLTQDDLAITYCEGVAWNVANKKDVA